MSLNASILLLILQVIIASPVSQLNSLLNRRDAGQCPEICPGHDGVIDTIIESVEPIDAGAQSIVGRVVQIDATVTFVSHAIMKGCEQKS